MADVQEKDTHNTIKDPLHQNLGVVRTLMDLCDKIVSEEEDRTNGRETNKEPLKVCGYPQWAIISVQNKMTQKQEKAKKKKGY